MEAACALHEAQGGPTWLPMRRRIQLITQGSRHGRLNETLNWQWESRQEAVRERERAEYQAALAQDQARLAQAQSLAGNSLVQLSDGRIDTALLLAIEAHKREPVPQARNALLSVLLDEPARRPPLRLPADSFALDRMTLSPESPWPPPW